MSKFAEQILRKERGEIRSFRKWEKILISLIAICWALFQLSLASFLILDSTKVRAIHLTFAIVLLFLNVPFSRRKGTFKFMSITGHIPVIDYLLAVFGALLALYIVFFWNDLIYRMGALNLQDIIVGLLLVIILLEATRRSIGPALPIIVVLFTLYSFFASHMPPFKTS